MLGPTGVRSSWSAMSGLWRTPLSIVESSVALSQDLLKATRTIATNTSVAIHGGVARLYVDEIDRLGRSLKDLIEQVANLERHGIELASLQESIDTTPAGG